MANNVLIKELTIRELSSGELGPFSFRADEGRVFTGPPALYVNGDEWDDSSGSILVLDDTATDHREFDRDGNGIYGTQTFKVSLKYDIGDIECRDEPLNTAYIDIPTSSFVERCADSVTLNTITFQPSRSGGDYPIFENWIWPKTFPSGFIYKPSQYPFLALGTTTYDFQVALEANALTFYSDTLIAGGNAFTITASNSKTVTVSTNVFSGTIDIYWGTIQVVVNGDFLRASMIFSNGTRSTDNWIRYKESCAVSPAGASRNVWKTINSIAKVNQCEFIGSNGGAVSYPSSNFDTTYQVMHSSTNAYDWGHIKQNRQADSPGGTDPIEPWGNLYQRDDKTILATYDQGIVRRSEDGGVTWTTSTDTLLDYFRGDSAVFFGNTQIHDVAYAGVNSSGNHVWYYLSIHRSSSGIFNNQILISVSEDDGKSFTEAIFYRATGSGYNEDLVRTVKSDYWSLLSGRYPSEDAFIHASIENDYLFVEMNGNRDASGNFFTYVLFRAFPSRMIANNIEADIRVVFEFQDGAGTPTDWETEYYYTSDNDYGGINARNRYNVKGPTFAIEDSSGFCLVTNEQVMAVSWNYGLNWADEINMSNFSVTKTFTPNPSLSFIYPETSPHPFVYDGKVYLYSGVQYNRASGSVYRNLSNLPNSGDLLRDGIMVPVLNKNNGLLTGEEPNGWSDQETYGAFPSLPSTFFGPYASAYAIVDPYEYGNGKAYIFTNYVLELDSSYQTLYWFTYNFKTDTTIATGNTSNFGGGFYPRFLNPHGNTLLMCPDPNSPVVQTRNALYKSTDDMQTATLVHTFPTANRFIDVICEYDGSSNNMLATQHTSGASLFYTTDGSTWQTVANLNNITGITSSSWSVNSVYRLFYHGSSGNCKIENGYMYLLDDNYYRGSFGRSFVVPVSEIADASNWANYEVTNQFLNLGLNTAGITYHGIGSTLVIGSKAFVVYRTGSNYPNSVKPMYYSLNDGSTWTAINGFTDVRGNVWTGAQLSLFTEYGKNHYGGQFYMQRDNVVGNKAGTNSTWKYHQLLWTEDFVNWDFAEWSAEDPNNDANNATMYPSVTNNGDDKDLIYALNYAYGGPTSKARKVVASDSVASSNPLFSDVVSSWAVEKEYDYVPAANVLSAQSNGYFTEFYEDRNTPSGVPMLLINHIYSVTTWPAALAPTIANEPPSITPPVLNVNPLDLEYTSATTCRKMRYQSDKVFTLVWTKPNGQLTQFDGIFDITIYTITTPLVSEGFANQTVEILHDETIDRILVEPSASLTDQYYSYWNQRLGLHLYYAAGDVHGIPWRINNISNLRHTLDRSVVQGPSEEGELLTNQFLYQNNFAVPIPLGYDMSGNGIFQAVEYGQLMFACMPKDRLKMDIIGMKIFTDFDGKGYPNGYYWIDNLYETRVGPTVFTSPYSSSGDWIETAAENTYIYIKNGFVTELGNAKNLPNYDRC